MIFNKKPIFYLLFIYIHFINCQSYMGPDPWNYDHSEVSNKIKNDINVPSDLRIISEKKLSNANNYGMTEWFFRRILAILLKGGHVKENDDGSVDVSLQMQFQQQHWQILNECLTSKTALSEENYRRSLGYVEEAIVEPTVIEKISMAWNEYVQFYLVQYKSYITIILSALAIITGTIFLWNHMSHRHLLIILFIFLYFYEVFTSYKDAEQKELERFLSAVDKCKWHFWSSSCDIPPPDPLIFIKYMNPLKICIRMFTNLISEPMITISDTVKVMIHGITDGLWFPFDKIMYGIIILSFNTLFVILLIMTIFNFIFNIPFNLNFFGFLNIGLRQRNRTVIPNRNESQTQPVETGDRISGETLNRILDIITTSQTSNRSNQRREITKPPITNTMQRSASTGRLSDIINYSVANHPRLAVENTRQRRFDHSGSGDQ